VPLGRLAMRGCKALPVAKAFTLLAARIAFTRHVINRHGQQTSAFAGVRAYFGPRKAPWSETAAAARLPIFAFSKVPASTASPFFKGNFLLEDYSACRKFPFAKLMCIKTIGSLLKTIADHGGSSDNCL